MGLIVVDGWFVVCRMTSTVKRKLANAKFGGGTATWGRGTSGAYFEIVGLAAHYDKIQSDLDYDTNWKEFNVWSKGCGPSIQVRKTARCDLNCNPNSTAFGEGYDFLEIPDTITPTELDARAISLFILHEPGAFEEGELLVEIVDSAHPLQCEIAEIDDYVNNFHNNRTDDSAFVLLRDILGKWE